MLCSKCGKPLTENACFCENCGMPVVELNESEERKNVPIGEYEELKNKFSDVCKKLEKSYKARNILIACMVFVVVGCLILLLGIK